MGCRLSSTLYASYFHYKTFLDSLILRPEFPPEGACTYPQVQSSVDSLAMDPFSAAAAVVGLADVALRTASALIEYTNNTQNASLDRKLLAEETYSLSKMLERLRTHLQNPDFDDKWLEERKDLVRQFARAYDELAASLNFDAFTGQLKQESRLKAIRTLSKWSFTKSEVYSLLERVTRLQQYLNMLLLEEQQSVQLQRSFWQSDPN